MAERTVVTKVSNAVLYSDGTVRIDNVRLSYPHLAKPFVTEGDDGQKKEAYSIDAFLPKATHTAAKDLVKKVIEDLMKQNDVKVGTSFWFLKDGDKQADEDENKAVQRGNFVVKASEKRRPAVRDRKGNLMEVDEVEDKLYGGCWANILIRPWYFSGKARNGKQYPKRMLSNLIAVQFVRDDEPFGEGRVNDDGVFDAVEEAGGGTGFDDEGDL